MGMPFSGQDIVDVGLSRIGQAYVFGARVPLDNPNWRGPWDCAEFVSWCTYQAYGQIFGAGNTSKVALADPYSGEWHADATKRGTVIPWARALAIPGAVLIRAPVAGKIGHVAIAMGDGERTLEARGRAFGVGVFGKAASRTWSIGCLLPGVEYVDYGVTTPQPANGPPKPPKPEIPPSGYLWLKKPNFKGGNIVALQRALAASGIDPGPIDGEYGPLTNAAVISFQVREGLEVDGVVGPRTAAALKLAFPLTATAEDEKKYRNASNPKGPPHINLPQPAAIDAVVKISQVGKGFVARTESGFKYLIGSTTSFIDDMNRVGLFQGKAAIEDSLKFGVYKAADYSPVFGQWAHFIEPTLSAEGGARFATLNTYDRAAFTFGAPQLAAHTPGENFVVYLRQLLGLPEAARHFPELSLRKNTAGRITVHLATETGFEDLEQVIDVVRPNGRKDKQLARLMAYLNASPTEVDANELSAAARLMNWLRLDAKAKELQISVFINGAKEKLARAKTRMPGFAGDDWRIALWVMDILHQGRGTYAEMAAALSSGSPEAELKRIGWPKYKTRILTVDAAAAELALSGVMTGFKV